MKKVAFFSEILIEDFDGASRTMYQIINRIDPNSFSYLFVYGRGPSEIEGGQSYQVPTFRIPMNDDYSFAVPQLAKWRLEETLDAFQPDVIHIATPSLLGFYALGYAKRKGIPVISIYHTHFISYIAYYFRNFSSLIRPVENWIRRRMRSFYNNCEKVYVPAHSIIRELEDIGIQGERLTLWQRGIDVKLFNPNKRCEAYIRAISKNDKSNILFASRLVWEKNIQTLIGIYQQLEQEGMPYNLIIAGDGTAKEEAMQLMPKAIFLGKLDHLELSRLYASADAFVFTSLSETYGNVVIEAMASGLPSVIANAGGSASLVEHGQTGYKCSPNNPKEYLFFLHKILRNEMLKEELRHAGLQYIKQLDWAKLTDTYFDDVQELAREPQRAFALAGQ